MSLRACVGAFILDICVCMCVDVPMCVCVCVCDSSAMDLSPGVLEDN
jgi:hypothetical protein